VIQEKVRLSDLVYGLKGKQRTFKNIIESFPILYVVYMEENPTHS
jgi:hypothetical protein